MLEAMTTAKREPLTTVQKILIFALLVCLNVPALVFVFRYSDSFSAREGAAVGLVNLVIVLPLVIFISEKWIRRIRIK